VLARTGKHWVRASTAPNNHNRIKNGMNPKTPSEEVDSGGAFGHSEISTATCFLGCTLAGGIFGYFLSRNLTGEIIVGCTFSGTIAGLLFFIIPYASLRHRRKAAPKKRRLTRNLRRQESILASFIRFDIRWMFALTAAVAVAVAGFSINWFLGLALSVFALPLFAACYCYLHVGLSFEFAATVCFLCSLFTGALVGFVTSLALTGLDIEYTFLYSIGGFVAGLLMGIFPYTGLTWIAELTRNPN